MGGFLKYQGLWIAIALKYVHSYVRPKKFTLNVNRAMPRMLTWMLGLPVSYAVKTREVWWHNKFTIIIICCSEICTFINMVTKRVKKIKAWQHSYTALFYCPLWLFECFYLSSNYSVFVLEDLYYQWAGQQKCYSVWF